VTTFKRARSKSVDKKGCRDGYNKSSKEKNTMGINENDEEKIKVTPQKGKKIVTKLSSY
jgi:hypothetical protein